MKILFGFAFIILLWVGGKTLIQDQITIGELVTFTVWLGMLAWPMISLGGVLDLTQRASASMNRIDKIMVTKPLIRGFEKTDHSIKKITGDIEFKNVSFA